jgi:hypothetical protein
MVSKILSTAARASPSPCPSHTPPPPINHIEKKGNRLQNQLNRLTSKARQQGFLFLFFFSFNFMILKIWKKNSKQIENLVKFSTFMSQIFHTVALPFTFKKYLKRTKNYGNSNISPSKNPLKETKILRDIITL